MPTPGESVRRLLAMLVVAGCTTSPTTSPSTTTPVFPVVNPAAVTPATLPTGGPWFHTVRTAASSDGLSFADERTADLVEHASVPSALRFPDGTLRIYFVDFSSGTPERLGCVESKDGGRSYTWGGCAVAGLTSVKAVDFCPVQLSDGTFRMYAFPQPDPTGFVSLRSSDGLAWSLEAGTRFTVPSTYQITDPYVIARGDGTWLMAYKRERRR